MGPDPEASAEPGATVAADPYATRPGTVVEETDGADPGDSDAEPNRSALAATIAADTSSAAGRDVDEGSTAGADADADDGPAPSGTPGAGTAAAGSSGLDGDDVAAVTDADAAAAADAAADAAAEAELAQLEADAAAGRTPPATEAELAAEAELAELEAELAAESGEVPRDGPAAGTTGASGTSGASAYEDEPVLAFEPKGVHSTAPVDEAETASTDGDVVADHDEHRSAP
jgi:hypothetical protein